MARTSETIQMSLHMSNILIVLALTGDYAAVVDSFFLKTPDDTLVMFGDSTQLNCTYGEHGLAAWYKGEQGVDQTAITLGNIIVNDDPHYNIIADEEGTNYHICIRDVDLSSEDNYECGDRIVIEQRASAHLYVINSVPVCSVEPSYVVRAGEHVTLNCSIDLNKNAPGELVWFRNGIEIHREEGQQSTMTIQMDMSDHGASYDCGLQHFTLPPWKWPKVTCQEKIVMSVKYTPGLRTAEKTTSEVMVGSFIDLTCTADGFPTPNIAWFDNYDDVITGNEGNRNIVTHIDNETIVSSILRFTVVDKSYYGIYRCQASNEVASSSSQIFNILEQDQRSASAIIAVISIATPALTCTVLMVVIYFYRRHLEKLREIKETASPPTDSQSPLVGKNTKSGNAGTSTSDNDVTDVASDETSKSTSAISANRDKEKGKTRNISRAKSCPVKTKHELTDEIELRPEFLNDVFLSIIQRNS